MVNGLLSVFRKKLKWSVRVSSSRRSTDRASVEGRQIDGGGEREKLEKGKNGEKEGKRRKKKAKKEKEGTNYHHAPAGYPIWTSHISVDVFNIHYQVV